MAKEVRKFNRQEEVPAADISTEEAKKFRASLAKPVVKKLSESDKRESFRLFWATEKYKYGKTKDLEYVLWLHLKAIQMDSPEKFEQGINNFGLKKE